MITVFEDYSPSIIITPWKILHAVNDGLYPKIFGLPHTREEVKDQRYNNFINGLLKGKKVEFECKGAFYNRIKCQGEFHSGIVEEVDVDRDGTFGIRFYGSKPKADSGRLPMYHIDDWHMVGGDTQLTIFDPPTEYITILKTMMSHEDSKKFDL